MVESVVHGIDKEEKVMILERALEGRYVSLRSATIEDADFTRSIRCDPEMARCFPRFENTLEQQEEWIRCQRNKQGDYFFVIWDKQGKRIGTFGVYNICEKGCESGRVIVKGNALQSIETQMLSFIFAFETLKVDWIVAYIYADNSRALRFSSLFGGDFEEADIYSSDKRLMVKYKTQREQFYMAIENIEKMIYRDHRRESFKHVRGK